MESCKVVAISGFERDNRPVEMVWLTEEESGREFCIPEWSVSLADKMHLEDISLIADLFKSEEDYLTALDAACADAAEGVNLPINLSEPTPLGIPHYRMQEALHRTLPLVRARLARKTSRYRIE